MKSLLAGFGAFAVLAALAMPASAGWDNVFQPTLFERWRQPSTTASYYVAPVEVQYQAAPVVVANSSPCTTCQSPPPQQPCQTTYVQRSYYQPVTVMQTETRYEPVTTYRTSYYYEPVTSYRVSLYVDPCTGCSQQVASPTVSYQLREQKCPVQSWVARCVQVPVTVSQKVDYWEPRTTCCTTTVGQPIFVNQPPPAQAPPPRPPLIEAVPNTQIPSIRSDEQPKGNTEQRYYPRTEKITDTNGTSWQQPSPGNQAPQAPVKFNQITVNPNSIVEGQVTRNDNTPKGNAKVLFINASTGKRETALTNSAGRFQTELPTGSWHVYLYDLDGQPTHQTRIDVNGAQVRKVSLVSRGS